MTGLSSEERAALLEGRTLAVEFDVSGIQWEDEYKVRRFKQFNPETGILQFWDSETGALRTLYRDRIVSIRGNRQQGRIDFD